VSMRRIDYKPSEVPSWSWMAYTGEIEFVVKDWFPQFDGFRNLKFAFEDRKVLITDLWEFGECRLKEEEGGSGAMSREIVTLSGRKVGWISYDTESGQDLPLKGSAVIGRSTTKESDYYILVLRHRLGNEYERVGIGMVQQHYISRQAPDVNII
jgi:hypothetical protein